MIPVSQVVKAVDESIIIEQQTSRGKLRKERESCMKTEMGRSEQAHHQPAVSETKEYNPEVNQSKSEQQSRMWNTMRWFSETEKTEAAFYVRFQDLAEEDVTFLKSFYNIGDDRELFRIICKFWDIGISNTTRSV
ncbi:MAG TPA: hypothetical protein ENI81_13270 [Phycisphaerales bacterium]|nr:hypothetical protein [Phycisphaerales bacterium]